MSDVTPAPGSDVSSVCQEFTDVADEDLQESLTKVGGAHYPVEWPDGASSVTQAQRIDEVCDRFEAAWKKARSNDQRPRIEDYQGDLAAPEHAVLLGELICLDITYRQWAGEDPSLAEYAARYPNLDRARLASMLGGQCPGESGAPTRESISGRPQASQGLRYRILRPHAKGGLGEVFVAEDQKLHRQVALKEIRREYADHAASQCRFLREAEVTGGLEHPGIVPVYDLGCYPDSRPFYAMRLIKGDSLWEAIRCFHAADAAPRDPGERSLVFRELLGRFVDACNALAYAHARGILHRDVKPHNIMLGKYGETLVVDWGLAKVIGQPEGMAGSEEGTLRSFSGADTPPTQAGDVLGTPAYMSPEQAEGQLESLGPASDIYSLGATLYELLTGTEPVHGQQVGELLAKVKLRTWPPPRQIKPGLPRALEAICLKAMARQPEDRYATALQLAADVESWLADEPVAAYSEPWVARWGRWGRRHRAVVAAAGALLLTAVVALAVSTILIGQREQEAQTARELAEQQRDRADDNLRLARQAVDNTVSKIADNASLKQINSHQLRRELLESMLPFYEKFVQQQQNDPESQAERGRAWHSLAYLREELGDKASARADYEQMRAIFVQLAADFPAVPQYRIALARSHNSLGNVLHDVGQPTEAETAYRQALKIRMQLAEEFPAVPEYRREVGSSHHNLGMVLWDRGNRIEAETAYRQALKIRMQLAEGFPAVPRYRSDLAETHHMLGDVLHDLGQPAKAETAYREALKIRTQLAEEFPGVPEYRWDLAGTHHNLGHVLRHLGQRAEAETIYRQVLKIRMRLAEEFPAVPQYRRDVAANHRDLADLLHDLGQRAEAETAYREALKIQTQLAQDFPAVLQYRQDLVASHQNLAHLLHDRGQWAEAETAYREALKIRVQLAEDIPAVLQYRRELAASHHILGNVLHDLGKHAEAEAAYREALKIQAQLVQAFAAEPEYRREQAASHHNLGHALRYLGKQAEAESTYREALKIRRQLAEEFPAVPQYRMDLAASRHELGNLLRDLGQRAEAETAYRQAQKIFAQLAEDFPAVPHYRLHLAASHLDLGLLLYNLGQRAEAETAYREALKIRMQLAEEFPAVPRYRWHLAGSHHILGNLLRDRGQRAEAETAYRQALKIQTQLVQAFAAVPDYRNDLAAILVNHADLLRRSKDFGQARRLLEEATPHHHAALKANPRHPTYRQFFRNNRWDLAQTLVELSEHAAAADTAGELAQLGVDPANDLYRAACIFARCVPLAERDNKELSHSYADRAVATMRQAVQNGYKDVAHMKKDTNLDPLRSHPEFQKLLKELDGK